MQSLEPKQRKLPVMLNEARIRCLKKGDARGGPVLYWMSRDQRVLDNWALLHAQQLARSRKEPLLVCFCLVPNFLEATIRQYGFMLRGLSEVATALTAKGIPFHLLRGEPKTEIPKFVSKQNVSALITDFDPLRIKRAWKKAVVSAVDLPAFEVDAHNIVPCWVASPKQEYAAYTLRPKIHRALPDFLEPFPGLRKHPAAAKMKAETIDWEKVRRSLKLDRSVGEVDWIRPGEKAARAALRRFLSKKLAQYDQDRNDPSRDGQSHLSPYLHFGHLSAQRVALEVEAVGGDTRSQDAFLEELVVRRELSDNFCYYNRSYDTVEAFPDWARKTLDAHREDPREYLYSKEALEQGRTHDPLWNAAQREMVRRGKMHGYMRMYWAKKILEWTKTPVQAMKIAIYLNDKYELDGRDPNGYAGIAWSVGGVHDRAWGGRPVFGKIRYMSARGCRSKFDMDTYVEWVASL